MVRYNNVDGKMKKSKTGKYINVKSLISLLKSYDSDEETIETMQHIIDIELNN